MKSRPAPRLAIAGLLALMSMVLVCGCGRDANPGAHSVKIVMLVDSRMDPLRHMQWLLLEHLVRQKAGCDFRWWDAGADEKMQATQLSEAMKLKPEVLMVFPVNAASISDALQKAKQDGAKVYVFADNVPEASCTAAIYCDERKLGRMAGEFVAQSVRRKLEEEGRPQAMGRVLHLTGPEESAVTTLRTEGFVEALAQQPGILVVHQTPAGMLGEGVSDRIAEALKLQKTFDVVFAHSDLMARAAATALVKVGLRDTVLVVGVDGAPGKGGGMQMVTRSEIDATLYHPPLVDVAWSLAQRGLKEPGFKPSPRQELQPVMIDLEKAIEWTRDGIPPPKPD